LISERTSVGLEIARSKGRIGGKPKGLSKEAEMIASKAYKLRLSGLTASENMEVCKVSRRTLFKYIRFEVQRLSEKENRNISRNGLDLI